MTIKDVAKRAGVSPATVSNVINNTKYVSDGLKARVNKAIDELDFQVDYIASMMKKDSTHTIGVVLTSLNRVFNTQVICGIQSVISKNDYKLIFYTTDNVLEKEAHYIRMLTTSKVDGIILNTAAHEKRDAKYLSNLAHLHNGNKAIPIVSIERNLVKYGIHSVHVNNVQGGEMATSHLIECGCRNIALLAGLTYSDIGQDRITGYKNILHNNNIRFDEDLVRKGDFTAFSGYRTTKNLLKEGIIFDGLFACNDEMAVGALRALTEADILVPEDIKVVGFDNTFVSTLVSPQISTINVPKYRIGSSAARILIRLIQNNEPIDEHSCEMPISTIIRGSTEKDKLATWDLEDW